ncbi:MAG TPA: hypothetical protein VIM84_11330 [Gemmatimonadales bacterium]
MDFTSTWPQPDWVTVTASVFYAVGAFSECVVVGVMDGLGDRQKLLLNGADTGGGAAAIRQGRADFYARWIIRLDVVRRWGCDSVRALGASVVAAQIITTMLVAG